MTICRALVTLCTMFFAACPGQATELQECWKQFPPERQIANCSKIIDQKPSKDLLADAFLHRASAYAVKGMLKEAIADYTRAIRSKSGNEQALSGRAQTNLTARNFDQAIVDFTAAIRINAKLASAYVGRGYAHLVKKEFETAVRDFTSALTISPAYVMALNNRGLAYKKLGKLKLAIADFSKAISISPLYALAYNNRGYVYEQTGDKSKAVDDFRNALAIDPSLIGARDGLVRLSAAGSIAAHTSNRIANGKQLAKKNCAWCHAIGVNGQSTNSQAPRFGDIHARHPILPLREPITRAIATPHDSMPKLKLTPAEVDLIIAYINSLRPAN